MPGKAPINAIFLPESSNLMLNIGLPDLEPTGTKSKNPCLISSSEEEDEEGTLQDEDEVEEERDDEEEEGEGEEEERTYLR